MNDQYLPRTLSPEEMGEIDKIIVLLSAQSVQVLIRGTLTGDSKLIAHADGIHQSVKHLNAILFPETEEKISEPDLV